MSIKHNVIANYIGQFYVTIIGIIMLPVYLRFMGKEAYGLVGFFGIMTTWLALIDMGFTPALGREVARFRGGAIDAGELRSLERAMLMLFSGIGLVIVTAVGFSSEIIAKHWLKVENLPYDEVSLAIALMGIVFALKWPSGIFRSVITSFERQVWLNTVNITIATIRFVGIIPVFNWLGATPRVFFTYQALVALLELIFLTSLNYRFLPSWPEGFKRPWTLAPLKNIWRFALSVAFLSFVWTMVTQTDKLVLTKLLPLSKYACYAIAVTAAGGIMILINPITQAVLPRLTRLVAEKKPDDLCALYRKTTRINCVISGSAAVILVMYAQPLLWAWTGDLSIASQAAKVLLFYALGNFFLAVSRLQYNLQFAHGDLRLHIKGNIIFPIVLVPSIIWAAIHYGMAGASFMWMMINLLFLLGWTPIVHHRFLPKQHMTWLIKDILPVVGALAFMAFLMSMAPLNCESRKWTISLLALWSIATLIFTSLVTREGRDEISLIIKKTSQLLGAARAEGE